MTEPLMLSSEETDFLLRAKEKGWVLVPETATEEMEEACWKALPYAVYNATQTVITKIPKDVYEAMLSAAPPLGRPMDDE